MLPELGNDFVFQLSNTFYDITIFTLFSKKISGPYQILKEMLINHLQIRPTPGVRKFQKSSKNAKIEKLKKISDSSYKT